MLSMIMQDFNDESAVTMLDHQCWSTVSSTLAYGGVFYYSEADNICDMLQRFQNKGVCLLSLQVGMSLIPDSVVHNPYFPLHLIFN